MKMTNRQNLNPRRLHRLPISSHPIRMYIFSLVWLGYLLIYLYPLHHKDAHSLTTDIDRKRKPETIWAAGCAWSYWPQCSGFIQNKTKYPSTFSSWFRSVMIIVFLYSRGPEASLETVLFFFLEGILSLTPFLDCPCKSILRVMFAQTVGVKHLKKCIWLAAAPGREVLEANHS